MSVFHPDLKGARFLPSVPTGPRISPLMARMTPRAKPAPEDMIIENVTAPASATRGAASVRLYRPKNLVAPAPAVVWIHGGGYVGGFPEQDETTSIAFARELGVTVIALRYRLAPGAPFPAAVDDAYAALLWVVENAEARGIDPTRVAIAGASAGGGLAAGLTLAAHDRGEVQPAFQLLVYPMLDDRTVTRTDHDTRNARVWRSKQNRFGWTSYLGQAPGSPDVSPYAAPARREDLSGLPPTWIGVGTLDLFHDEDVVYAERLKTAGVPTELFLVDGAFHGFDVFYGKTDVVGAFRQEQVRALREALLPEATP